MIVGGLGLDQSVSMDIPPLFRGAFFFFFFFFPPFPSSGRDNQFRD